jgi:hypothetical protein
MHIRINNLLLPTLSCHVDLHERHLHSLFFANSACDQQLGIEIKESRQSDVLDPRKYFWLHIPKLGQTANRQQKVSLRYRVINKNPNQECYLIFCFIETYVVDLSDTFIYWLCTLVSLVAYLSKIYY